MSESPLDNHSFRGTGKATKSQTQDSVPIDTLASCAVSQHLVAACTMSDYDDEDERPSFGGLGAGQQNADDEDDDPRPSFGGLGSNRPGLGGGLGFTAEARQQKVDEEEDDARYGSLRKRPKLDQTAGLRSNVSTSSNEKSTGLGGKFAAKMMAQMGYKQGQGLGCRGEGRTEAISVMQRFGFLVLLHPAWVGGNNSRLSALHD